MIPLSQFDFVATLDIQYRRYRLYGYQVDDGMVCWYDFTEPRAIIVQQGADSFKLVGVAPREPQ